MLVMRHINYEYHRSYFWIRLSANVKVVTCRKIMTDKADSILRTFEEIFTMHVLEFIPICSEFMIMNESI